MLFLLSLSLLLFLPHSILFTRFPSFRSNTRLLCITPQTITVAFTTTIMFTKELIAFAAGISSAAAVYQGFNYGSSTDFATEFALAKNLVGTSGDFASARLYTMIVSLAQLQP